MHQDVGPADVVRHDRDLPARAVQSGVPWGVPDAHAPPPHEAERQQARRRPEAAAEGRDPADEDALWKHVERPQQHIVASDAGEARHDADGQQRHGQDADFERCERPNVVPRLAIGILTYEGFKQGVGGRWS